MQTTIKIVSLFTTSLFFLFACDKKQETKSRELEVQKVEEKTAQKPKNTISFEEAKSLQEEYTKTRAESLNKILNKKEIIKGKDVIDVTFHLEELKQYIAYVEAEAGKKGLKGLGLRVYFGAYKKANKKVKTPGYSTVFFMPTYQPSPETTKANNFFYFDTDEIIDGVDGFNYGQGGNPPQYLN